MATALLDRVLALSAPEQNPNEDHPGPDEVARLKEQIFLLETLMDTIPDQIYFKDRDSRFTRINPAEAKVFGLSSPSEAVGRSDFDYFTLDHATQAFRDEQEIVRTGRPLVNVEERETKSDGSVRWVSTTKMPLRNTEGQIIGTFGVSRDITQRKYFEAELERHAFYDLLTQLPNRALFMNRIRHLFRGDDGSNSRRLFAVLYLDVDRFKTINDSFGHQAGDDLLKQIARRLEQCVRTSDTLARLGGDEFTALLSDLPSEVDAIRVASKIQEELAKPFVLCDVELFATASIGIAFSSSHYQQPEDMLRDADTAMYRAKSDGRARHQVFDIAMHERAVSLLRVENDLRRAIERQELVAFYQPVVDVTTHRLRGFEALVRWQHPTQGLLMPDVFIPIAEEAGMIKAIGKWVLTECCRQTRAWQIRYPRAPALQVSVNVSTRQLVEADISAEVLTILSETGFEAKSLSLEITESALMQNVAKSVQTLQKLHDLGVRICIDDFGTGYSSLSYLQNLPIDTLKIDRSFVTRLDETPAQVEIVRAIVALAHNLGMHVVAEGVETSAQASALAALGCTHAQGYLYSRPVSAEQAEQMIVHDLRGAPRNVASED
jgi:diguanylate cyclase (GGDEF)-like protein/PAS domain S-box-containing protein